VENNHFSNQDGRYSILIHCEEQLGSLDISGNLHEHALGGSGAPYELDPLSGGTHGVGCCAPEVVEADERPVAFALLGNVPNPFNPVTTLRFQLAETASVRLSVVDLAGREVALLSQGLRSRGEHQVVFDASALPSGVYLARLLAGGRTEMHKMMLVK